MAIPGNLLSSTTESMDPTYAGWRARLNCTLLGGTGGRNGAKCMAVKSTAAGEMQAETISAYPVIPGETYQVLADASSSAQPERIGIEWLDASYKPVGSITWSMTTASATSAWHRVSVAGPAPANAVRARVVLSSSPSAAAVYHYWENVYLGLPIRTTGNLLSFNAESTEVDASSWTSEANCTISRTAPASVWPVDYYRAGGHVVALTATTAGDAVMRTVERPAAAAGVEYLAWCHLNPPTSSATTWIELRFHDSAGAQLQAIRALLVSPGTGNYRQIVSAEAPSGSATCSVAVGITGASASQVLRIENAGILQAPVLRAGSVVPYADASFEQGVAGWTVQSGAATIARSSPWGAHAVEASYSLTVSSATATSSVLRSGLFRLPSDSDGVSFRSEVAAKVSAGGWTHATTIRWYDSSGAELDAATDAALTIPPGGSWWSLTKGAAAPAGATHARLEWQLTATAGSSVLQLDKVTLFPALPLTDLSAVPDRGYLKLILRELTSGQLISVYRMADGKRRILVRGPYGLLDQSPITTDLMLIEDYEAPLGEPVSYYIETRNPGSASPTTIRSSQALVLDPGDANEAWLKDPAAPQRNVRVMVGRAPDWQRPIEQSEYRVRGRRNSVVLSAVRGGLEGELMVWTRTDAERDRLHWLLDSGRVLLWQAAPGRGVTDVYVNVGTVAEARDAADAEDTWRTWTLPLKEADMPTATGVVGSAGRTWSDLLAEFGTWNDVLNSFATWEDVLLDNRLGG